MTTNQPNIEVHNNASREQLERIFDILGNVFPVGRAFFQERADNDPTYNPANTWFATVDGVIASSVQIFPMPLRAGNTVLKVAGMGSVCTDENYQGKGLASRILSAQTAAMKQQGYHLSMLLASKHNFYSRSGWKLISETLYQLNNPVYDANRSALSANKAAGNLENAGAVETTVSFTAVEAAQTASQAQASLSNGQAGEGCTITAFSPEQLGAMSKLYDSFNAGRTGTYVRDETYWSSLVQWPTWREAECLLLWQQDKLIAYGIIARTRNEQAILREFIYDPQSEADVMPLFAALCQLRSDARLIAAKLPSDHLLYAYFQKLGASSVDLDIAMWKIIDCAALFSALQPQLQKRLQASEALSNTSFRLSVQTGQDRILFSYRDQQLQLAVEAAAIENKESDADEAAIDNKESTDVNAAVQVSELELIKWLLYGYESTAQNQTTLLHETSSGQNNDSSAGADTGEILRALFPAQPYAFYITDYY